MKMNFWSVVAIILITLTVVIWIIPAIFEWQKNLYLHREKMAMLIATEPLQNNTAPGSNDAYHFKIIAFVRKTFSEVVPSLIGKIIDAF
jgi:hypothetical protein